MSSTASGVGCVPLKLRPKRYLKVKSGTHATKNKQTSSKFVTPNTKLKKTVSCTTPTTNNYLLNDSPTMSLPSSLRSKKRTVTPSERQKRWQIVAEENKELLDKVNYSHYNSLRDSPLLNDFRKRKSDPEFRRSLKRPCKAIKVFSDEEEDNKLSNSSNGFPFNKAYDDHFRNLKLFDSDDEEFNKWIKDTKGKKSKSSYKGGPLADEYLLPMDYTKLLDSD